MIKICPIKVPFHHEYVMSSENLWLTSACVAQCRGKYTHTLHLVLGLQCPVKLFKFTIQFNQLHIESPLKRTRYNGFYVMPELNNKLQVSVINCRIHD